MDTLLRKTVNFDSSDAESVESFLDEETEHQIGLLVGREVRGAEQEQQMVAFAPGERAWC